MKKLKILIGILIFTLTTSSCRTTYIKDRPLDVEVVRPPSPGHNYVWLNHNWIYHRGDKVYTRQGGNWAKPKANRTYRQGYWKSNKKGNRWVSGRWK